jgi:DNA invertase Pin-like site-specific DNA recombinase
VRLVAYYRVSTGKQGIKGLGMEAQHQCVEAYALSGGHHLLRSYTEVESGRRDRRPQLEAAIKYSKLTGSRLIIAKLDRLTRNARFLAILRDSHVSFIACDTPHADEFTINILAAVAQKEAELISARTKAAMAVLKARGQTLGAPGRIPPEAALRGAKQGAAQMAKKARFYTEELGPRIAAARADGASLQQIANALNTDQYRTPTGKPWNPMQVSRVLARYHAPQGASTCV